MKRDRTRGGGNLSLVLLIGAATSGVPMTAASAAEGSEEKMIEEALGAAPPGIAETATVVDHEGNVLREGNGAYTCMPSPNGVAGPMCMDEEWMKLVDAWQKKAPFTASRVGIAYMLKGDSASGGASNTDPFAMEPSSDNDWVVEGPHMMLIVPDPAALEGLPTSLDADGPYVMWKGTPYAHIMMPIGERPAQRQAAAN